MGMKHRLPFSLTSVELQPELTIGELGRNVPDKSKKTVQNFTVFQGRDVWRVGSRNTEDMNLGLWVNVAESDRVLVLTQYLSTKLAGNDFAKNTIQDFLQLHTTSETRREAAAGQQLPRVRHSRRVGHLDQDELLGIHLISGCQARPE